MQTKEELLAGDLGGQLAHRQIGDLILGIVPWTFRQRLGEIIHHVFAAGTRQRGDHEGALECDHFVRSGRKLQQILAANLIDLVEDEDLRLMYLLQALEDRLRVTLDPALAVDQQHDQIGVLGSAPGRGDHGAVEPTPRLEDAGRVHEDDLRAAVDRNAADDRPRRLHLVADDRHFRADKAIDQCRLAGIRRPDQRHEARARRHCAGGRILLSIRHDIRQFPAERFCHTPSRSSNFIAATCSAPRLERSTPVSGAIPSTSTVTVKRGS